MFFISNSGTTATQNMAIDEELTQQALLHDLGPIYRFYEWKSPASVTYTAGKELPPDLAATPSSERLTGGGIVFHCPGDVVFCAILPLHDPRYPAGVKPKMDAMSTLIQTALKDLGIQAHRRTEGEGRNILFCNSYPNPYELFVNNEKCCAIAMRKFRQVVVMQGVIHLKRSKDHFQALSEVYGAYFTEGISFQTSAAPLIARLYDHLKGVGTIDSVAAFTDSYLPPQENKTLKEGTS